MEISQETTQHVLSLNKDAMSSVMTADLKISLKMLQDSLLILNNCHESQMKNKLLGITYNNLGCINKRMKKDLKALKYLQLACECERNALINSVDRASTHLNMCAIFSSLNQHESALKQSKQALELLSGHENDFNYIPTLVIAYHNTAVEYEYQKHFKLSLDYYQLAHRTAEQALGRNHSLTISTGNDLSKAEKKIKTKETLEIIKEVNHPDHPFLRKYQSRHQKIQQKIKYFKEKTENFKVLPYLSHKSVRSPPQLSDSALGRLRTGNRSQEKTVLKTFSDVNFLNVESPARIRTNTPIFTSFQKKKKIVVLPESLRASKLPSGRIFLKEEASGLDLETENFNKSGSLRKKTLLLIEEIESLKNQILKEKKISLERRSHIKKYKGKNSVLDIQALVRRYLEKKDG
jgi:tetratricopeptide (TPR) repeat protein